MSENHIDTLHLSGLASSIMDTWTGGMIERPPPRLASGFVLAAVSAIAFGLSGPIAKGLLDAGWSAGAAVAGRILIAATVLVLPGALAMRGRWHVIPRNIGVVFAYGAIAVAGCQLSFFNAVRYMPVGVALLIEYTAPMAVVGWLWLRHMQRPSAKTVLGGAISAVGLVLVLDLVSGGSVDPIGVLWALGAMAGLAVYWIMSGDEDSGLPPIALAAGGLLVGGVILVLAGLVGIVPFAATSADVVLAGSAFPWWIPVVALGVITAAIAYVCGIAAVRRLGSRLASFVGLTEVLAALVFSWLLLDQTPGPIQIVGGLFILFGVVLVKLGEKRMAALSDTLNT